MPCGGYENEDAKIKQELKNISEGKECDKLKCENGDCHKKEEGPEKIAIKTYCKKCTKGRAILLYKGDPVCQECLFKVMEYKVRLLL